MMDDNELSKQIGNALRRAAALPPLDDPINDIYQPDELHLPALFWFVALISSERFPTTEFIKRPRKVAKELATIRKKIGGLRKHIEKLDEPTTAALNWAGSAEKVAYEKALETVEAPEDLPHVIDPTDYILLEEYQEWGVQILLDAMARLDVAAFDVESQLTGEAEDQNATKPSGSTRGRKKVLSKRNVAVAVAEYIAAATGKLPTFWKSKLPSGPFPQALDEIFKLLKLPSGIDNAGQHAIKTIKTTSRKFITNEQAILKFIPENELRAAARAAGMEWAPEKPKSP